MTVSFNTIPSSGVLVPLFYAEMDNSQANTAQNVQPAILFGCALPDSAMPLNELTLVSSVGDLRAQAGAGSQLARMAAAYRKVDMIGQLWAIAVPEPEGEPAAGMIQIGGNSYLDSETLHTSAYVLRALETCVTSKYGRHKLASDGTRFGPGQAIVTPAVIKAEMCAQYQIMEEAGIVENFDLFKKYLVVERNANDPNRVNVLFPPDYINQLRVFALVNQFRLQYQEVA